MYDGRMRIPFHCRGAMILTAVLLSSIAVGTGPVHAAAPGAWITVYESRNDAAPRVHLDRLPQRSPAIDGILAMVAFQQTPFGCEGPRDAMDCPITRDLGLGLQCSDAHVAFVRRWFPDRIPKLGGRHERHYSGFAGKGPDASMCAQTPTSASVQSHLSSLRIRQSSRKLSIESRVMWYARERSGEIVYRTRFRLDGDALVLRSSEVIRQTRHDRAADQG